MVSLVPLEEEDLKEGQVPLDKRVILVHKVHRVSLDPQVGQEEMATLEGQVLLGLKAELEEQVQLV